jgi:HAD superfamily hydrolase (TIGR01490 family)
MNSIAFFDVDNTLMKGFSGFYTTLALIRKGILKKRRLPLAFFYRLISPVYKGNLRKMYEIAIADMAGSRLEEILRLGRDCFERWIKPRLYREGIERIREHKEKGEPVYLMTSGPYMTIKILADFLGADGRYSTGPVIDEKGILTDRLRFPICYREGKVTAAEEVIRRHGASWKDCYYYADNIDDIYLLEKVGHPRIVNPDGKLLRIGRERGWPILNFSRLLGSDGRAPLTEKAAGDNPRT